MINLMMAWKMAETRSCS